MSSKKEKIYEYVELDDRIPIQKLSVGDQLRALLQKLTYDPAQELKREDVVTMEHLRLKADLFDFIDIATDKVRRGIHKSVDFQLSSKFEPVFEDVMKSDRFNNYKLLVSRPDIEYDIPYFFTVRLQVEV